MTMAHARKRHSLELLLKKLKFSPVVSIQGPRQVGKSFLAKNLLPETLKKAKYLTLDKKENRSFAIDNPHSFLTQTENQLMIIDEAQKAPELFDEIKSLVDDQRKPGQFLLLGSTEFSHETEVQESLTGRLSRLRLYPLSLAETLKIEPNTVKTVPFYQNRSRAQRADLLRYLENGGFPGIFAVKNQHERLRLWQDWLKLTVERDLHQLKKFKLDADLALNILESIAILEEPSDLLISKRLNVALRKVQLHLKALKLLFVIFDVQPFAGSSGKALYFLTDLGLLTYFKAHFQKKITTWIYLETLTQLATKDFAHQQLYYFKKLKTQPINLVYANHNELVAIKFIFTEKYDSRDYLIFKTFDKIYSEKYKIIRNSALFGGTTYLKSGDIKIVPYEALV